MVLLAVLLATTNLQASAFVAPRRSVLPLRDPVILLDQVKVSENTVDEPKRNSQSDADIDDLGKTIFLANSLENTELVEAFASDPDVTNPQASLTDAVLNMKQLDETVGADASTTASPSTLEQPVTPSNQDTVNAILAASEQAMQKAEAELLPTSNDPENLISVTPDLAKEPVKVVVEETSVMDTAVQQPLNEVVPVRPKPAVDIPSEPIQSPSVGKILKFAIPAVGVWLCSPLLSLIDTAAVGILSGTAQQAALNPAVAVTDYAALLIAFMYTGTTNLVAAAWEKDKHANKVSSSEKSTKTSRTLVGAMQLSLFVGAGLGAVLFGFAPVLLRSIIGNDAINPAVFAAAMKYVRIRALGMPAAVMIGSAQAACLGMQDIKSPLYVLAAAAIVNFVGDMIFVGSSHPLIGGAAGAAWATVFSQYAALTMFMHWLTHRKREKPMNLSKAILDLTSKPSTKNKSRRKRLADAMNLSRPKSKDHQDAKPKKEAAFSIRGFLEGKLRKRELVKVPPKETLDDFAPYVLPVTSTQVGRVSGYVAMSHVVSSSLGTVSMAAQQVIVSLFYCLCPIADSLSLTAQSFLPSIAEKEPSLRRAKALRETILNFTKAGAVFGAVMMAAVACIPFISGVFTSDTSVVSLVNMVAPVLVGIFSVHGIVCGSEGLLLGQKDLGFLGKMYAGFFAVVPWLMLRVKRAALSSSLPCPVNLKSVWNVFLGYQLFRAGAWALRLAQLQRRTEKEAATI